MDEEDMLEGCVVTSPCIATSPLHYHQVRKESAVSFKAKL